MIIKKLGNACIDKVYKLTVIPVDGSQNVAGDADTGEAWETEGTGAIDNRRKLLMENAAREAEEIKESAFRAGTEKGYSDGYAKGYDEAKRSFERELNILEEIKRGLGSYREEILKMSEKEITRLSVTVAEKIIRQKVAEDSSIVMDSLKVALKSVPQLDRLIIHLNPDDYMYIKSRGEEIDEIINRYKEIKFIDDKRIEKGGCVIETEIGSIDTQISSQLKKISGEVLSEADKKI